MNESIGGVSIGVDELSLAYGDQVIFEKANLTIHENEFLGLVGRNGCGKSTFMKILVGLEEPREGKFTRKKGLQIGFLPQEFTLDDTLSVYDNIKLGCEYITEMIREFESLTTDSIRFRQLENLISEADGWNLSLNIDKISTALQCPAMDSPIRNLSGGEKRRIALAKTLVSRPNLLLLDEPTNHLDTNSIEWLESFLKSYRGTCLLITHDRYFLDRVSTRIIELNAGQFQSFKGNYTEYLCIKANQMDRDEIVEHKRQKYLTKELEWVRRGPKARTTKAQFRVNRYYDLAAQSPPEKILDIDLIIPPAERMGNRVVDLCEASMSYEDKVLFENFSCEIQPGSKIGIIGPNGIGKTTLVKIITGQIKPTNGSIKISSNTKFNLVDQERLTLNYEKTVVEEIGEGNEFVQLGAEKISIWGYLKRFLFTDERIRTKIERLSGGEKARLILAKILKRGGNFIILDEPTNDLDLSTLRLLEEALIGYKGCILLVSHDRFFLNRVCSGIFAFEKNNQITYHEGNYDYYMGKRAQYLIGAPEKKSKKSSSLKQSPPKEQKFRWKNQRELEGIEEKIMVIEEEIESLQTLFSSSDFYKETKEKISEYKKLLDEAQSRRDRLYQRWEELEMIKKGGEIIKPE